MGVTMTDIDADQERALAREIARRAKLRLRISQHLTAVTDLCEDLEAEAINRYDDHELPGGDAMVMLGPSANLEAWQSLVDAAEARYFQALEEGREATWLEISDQDSDPAPPLLVLSTWEETIRNKRDQPTYLRPTMKSATKYLRDSTDWAIDNLPAVANLADELHQLRSRLESLLHDGHRDLFADEQVCCLRCGSLLRRRMLDDGYEDQWWCYGCYRNLAPHEFYLAAAEAARLVLLGIGDEVCHY